MPSMLSLYLEPLNSSQNSSRLEILTLMMHWFQGWVPLVGLPRWDIADIAMQNSHCLWHFLDVSLACHLGIWRPAAESTPFGTSGVTLDANNHGMIRTVAIRDDHWVAASSTLPCYIYQAVLFNKGSVPTALQFCAIINEHELSMVKPILGMDNNRSYIKGKTRKLGIQSSKIGVFARAWKERRKPCASIASMSFWMVSRSTSLK